MTPTNIDIIRACNQRLLQHSWLVYLEPTYVGWIALEKSHATMESIRVQSMDFNKLVLVIAICGHFFTIVCTKHLTKDDVSKLNTECTQSGPRVTDNCGKGKHVSQSCPIPAPNSAF